MGLEDLEGCEHFFSKSNALAASTRYATTFHRKQKIVEYMSHMDAFEMQHNISAFLVNNYRQALDLKKGKMALRKIMEDQGIESMDIFHRWLDEEWQYLKSLSKEPIQETLEMEYYQKLVKYHAASEKLSNLRSTWVSYNPPAPLTKVKGAQRQYLPETQVRHAQEAVDNALMTVHRLEVQLKISECWTRNSEQWKAAAMMVGHRRYQQCLDELEGLIVLRYKMQKHIGKVLKTQSQAIRTALERYNMAAALVTPTKPPLAWEQVLAQDPLFTGSIVAGTPLDKTLLTAVNPKLSMDVDSPEEDLGQMSGSEDEDHSDDKDTLQTVAVLEALAASGD
ncbi:hypothetical protein C0991_009106 [Blastosporella zonata]|nr:hypothetical protein C0991_009106 [Blastosporella zonata]